MISVEKVVKTYRGRVRALDGVSLQVASGSAVGVIGVNGAGKSTLLRLLMGFVRPTEGSASIAGLAPRAYVERYGVAYVPERVAIPPGWRVRGALNAYAMLGEVAEDAGERVEWALRRLGLEAVADRRVGALSKGTVQRLAIAQALLGDRRVMVLDEPTDGLDPVWIAEMRGILAEWHGADPERVLLIASHNLAEVERLTDRVLVLHEGRVRDTIEGAAAGSLEARFLERVAAWGGAR